MHNLLAPMNAHSGKAVKIFGRDLHAVVDRLDALMMVLKSCKEESCRNPWKKLHPDGDVGGLLDTLGTEFDAFYESQPKVSFSACELGYIVSAEGPQSAMSYGQQVVWGSDAQKPLIRQDWSIWV